VLPAPETSLESREIRISWSRLREHAECKKRAALKAEGKKSPVTNIRVFFPGTVADRVMRRWLCQPEQKPGEMAAMVGVIMDEEERIARETGDGVVHWRGPQDRDWVRDWCQQLVTQLEPILYERAVPFEYEPAWRFRLPLNVPYLDGSPQRVWVIGEMDLFVRHPGPVLKIWDLKATADNSYWRKNVGQLVFYDLAAFLQFGQWTVECGLIQPMCREQVLRFILRDQDRRELLALVTSYCLDVWGKVQTLRLTSDKCGFCDVSHACPRYAVPAGHGRVPWT
jgi:PD-(D/E)XK nuclease superfamily